MEYSHRDRRAHRDVARGLAAAAAVVAGFTLFDLLTPWALSGVLAVIVLALVGVGFVVWGERLLEEYVRDLQSASRDARGDGFARAEVVNLVGLERPIGLPTERSPHSRRRPLGSGTTGDLAAEKDP
jgi:hypothetical protein